MRRWRSPRTSPTDENRWTPEDDPGGYALADLPRSVTGRIGPNTVAIPVAIPVEAPPAALQWTSGTLRAVAADGSALVLRPIADDSMRLELEIDGETFVRKWGKVLRVRRSRVAEVAGGC